MVSLKLDLLSGNKVSEYDQEIPQSHVVTLQINPKYNKKKEPQNTNSHKTTG